MTIPPPPVQPRYQVPPFPVRQFTVDEYHLLIQTGILKDDERLELLDGWITPKMPRNPPHDAYIDQVEEALRARLPAGWRLRVQSAITLSQSEPEPDIAVVPGPASRYRTHHPGPAEIALLVEVADSSLERDRNDKGPIYAQASIGEYWIVNLVDHIVEVYTSPTGTAYQQRQDYTLADVIPLHLFGQVVGQVPVVELLG
jgi:Uma2 family endonuclease